MESAVYTLPCGSTSSTRRRSRSAVPTRACSDRSRRRSRPTSSSERYTTHDYTRAHTHTRARAFNGPLSGTTRVSRYQKGKPIWILLKQETVSGSGISWTICKSAPRSRQITMPAPHHSGFTGRMPFLPPNQQRQSTEGITHD